jgi:hypothetical protein
MAARWVGSREIREVPDSPDWDFSNTDDSCTRVFEGPYDKILASPPTTGQVMAGVPAGFYVDRVKVKRHKSGKGTMTVMLSRKKSGTAAAGPEQPQYEVEWSKVDRPLETHPRYGAGGAKELAEEDLVDIEKWKDEKNESLRKDFKYTPYDGSTSTVELGASAKDLARKLLKGTTSYQVYVPVLRKTTPRRTKKAAAGAGFRDTPSAAEFGTLPVQKSGAAYVWMKTADRSVKSGRNGTWNGVEEWMGFDAVDTDLYS